MLFSVAHTEALREIAPKWPISDLLSIEMLSSVGGHVLIQFIFQISLFFAVRVYSWYTEPAYDVTGEDVTSDENTSLFLFANFIYITTSMILAVGPPFRKYVWTNSMSFLSFACSYRFAFRNLSDHLPHSPWIRNRTSILYRRRFVRFTSTGVQSKHQLSFRLASNCWDLYRCSVSLGDVLQ
jgi:hypothetical protein